MNKFDSQIYKDFVFQNATQKWQYLTFLANKFGSFEVFALITDKNGNRKPLMKKRLTVMDLWEMEQNAKFWSLILEINQRSILYVELIIDIDDKDERIAFLKAIKVYEKLRNFSSYIGLFKSAHGYHIHVIIKWLGFYERKEREIIREKIISEVNADSQLSLENHLVSLEFCKHWKIPNISSILLYGNWYEILKKAIFDLET